MSQGLIHRPELKALVDDTRPGSAIVMPAFDAIVVAGRQAPMFSFEAATDLHATFATFFEAGKVAAALCLGSAIPCFAGTPQGEPAAKGRTVTAFGHLEEDFADQAVWSCGPLPRGRT